MTAPITLHPSIHSKSSLAQSSTTSIAQSHCTGTTNTACRQLIVDTDLGLDDLVALAILRVQQSIFHCHSQQKHDTSAETINSTRTTRTNYRQTPFHLKGVTITPGISHANYKTAELLRRLLPPGTPVYVGGNGAPLAWNDTADKSRDTLTKPTKPKWWTRTAQRVENFLSSLPPLDDGCNQDTKHENDSSNVPTAEEFLASILQDSNVDVLCMAPLSTVAGALKLRPRCGSNEPPNARFYIMGGIRHDSRWTKRGESTDPFGYHDVVGESGMSDVASEKDSGEQNDSNNATTGETSEVESIEGQDHFGEFNFALDIEAARTTLTSVSAQIIPLEACTLVPKSLRCESNKLGDTPLMDTLSSIHSHTNDSLFEQHNDLPMNLSDATHDKELKTSQNILRQLLDEYGTDETQWDSISAAIYCNAFGSQMNSDQNGDNFIAKTDLNFLVPAKDLDVSDLGVLFFPGCSDSTQSNNSEGGLVTNKFDVKEQCPAERGNMQVPRDVSSRFDFCHTIHPAFSLDDELIFFKYLSYLLHADGTSIFDLQRQEHCK